MASLGSLGRDNGPADVTFDWFGTEIRCHPDISATSLVDYMEKAAAIDQDSPEALSFTKDFLRACIQEDDFDDYWTLALKHRQDIEDHMRVAKAVIEAATDRPTSLPSESAGGQPSSSEDASMASLLEQALPGRPDLQAGVGQELIAKQGLRAV